MEKRGKSTMSNITEFSSSLLGERYYKIEHDSGLTVFVFPKNMSTTYGIFSVNFGGNATEYCVDGENVVLPQGCAHFLEHKLFENEDGSTADDVFSALGAYDNAYTSNERTAYIFSATSNVNEAVSHLLYFVTHPYFTKQTVKKEIGIIAEEIRGCMDDPYDRCYMNMLGAMYFENPVKNEICGSEKSISRITPEVLYRCCKDFYTPENMVLCLCGNITAEETVEIVDREIGKERVEYNSRFADFEEPRAVKENYVEKRMPVGKPLFCIGIKDCDIPEDPVERYKKTEGMNILLHMMLSEAGEFYLEMLEKGIVSPGFDSGYSASPKTAYVMISGESENPKLLLEKIKEHIEKCRREGLDRADFEREKKCVYASYVSDFDSTEDIAFALTSYAYDGIDVFDFPKIIDGVTFEYVTELLNNVFSDECYTLSAILPLNEE
jgi:predicted Zn-dependent peptidase